MIILTVSRIIYALFSPEFLLHSVNKFVLQADAPDPSKLPPDEILGVTVVLVTCSYQEREFIRIGYYVNNEYTVPLAEEEVPPSWPVLDLRQVQRHILADKPRVTKFPIPWGSSTVDTAAVEGMNTNSNAGNSIATSGDEKMQSTPSTVQSPDSSDGRMEVE